VGRRIELPSLQSVDDTSLHDISSTGSIELARILRERHLHGPEGTSAWEEFKAAAQRVAADVAALPPVHEAPDELNGWFAFRNGVIHGPDVATPLPSALLPELTIAPYMDDLRDVNGEIIRPSVPESDSAIYQRAESKAQVNIWNWPVGSGEIFGYRTDPDMPPEVRAATVPRIHADNDIGEWNTFEITLRGDRLSVVLNDHLVIDDAQLPGIPTRGRLALQHHGHQVDGEWASAPSLVQFRNIYIRALDESS
jgi:hypothetical protein